MYPKGDFDARIRDMPNTVILYLFTYVILKDCTWPTLSLYTVHSQTHSMNVPKTYVKITVMSATSLVHYSIMHANGIMSGLTDCFV